MITSNTNALPPPHPNLLKLPQKKNQHTNERSLDDGDVTSGLNYWARSFRTPINPDTHKWFNEKVSKY